MVDAGSVRCMSGFRKTMPFLVMLYLMLCCVVAIFGRSVDGVLGRSCWVVILSCGSNWQAAIRRYLSGSEIVEGSKFSMVIRLCSGLRLSSILAVDGRTYMSLMSSESLWQVLLLLYCKAYFQASWCCGVSWFRDLNRS